MITDVLPLPSHPSLEQYRKQAKELVESFKSGETEALRRVKTFHPRGGKLQDSTAPPARFALADAQLVIAREHGFANWPKFTKHIQALTDSDSPVSKFERAADAIATGDLATLKSLLREIPEIIRARSTRAHRGTLLHYVGANGIEDYRQKTPRNAVEILNALLKAGARVDATADMYNKDTTLGLVATSVHPLNAGVQEALMETLIRAGAAVDGLEGGGSAVNACLANGRGTAAEYLAQRGARLDLEGAAGVGRLDLVKGFFNEDGSLKANATPAQMRDGFAWACEYGRTEVVDFLLQRGMEIDTALRNHGQTGLHWAAFGGHVDTVRRLLARNAPVDIKDASYSGTPLEWALYGWGISPSEGEPGRYYEVVALLAAAGATIDPQWLEKNADRRKVGEKLRSDPHMLAALRGERDR